MFFRFVTFRFIAIFFLLLTAGCLPQTEIDSAKTPGFILQSNRMQIIEQMGGAAPMQKNFNAKFSTLLNACNIEAVINTTKVAQPDPTINTTLVIQIISMKYWEKFGMHGKATRYSFGLFIKDKADKVFWKSEVELLPENIKEGSVTASDKPELAGGPLADAVFLQMMKDGLFSQCAAQTP